jgi:phytol kinase
MFEILISLIGIGLLLVLNQYAWSRKLVRGEASRKLAHISIGTFIATWPIYMSWGDIRIALAIGLLGAVVVRYFHIFPSLFDVQRSSIGDIVAPLVIILAAVIEPTKTIFAVTVLHIAFADGMAAVIGSRFGQKTAYNIVKQRKTLLGTATFYASSVLIMTMAAIFKPTLDTGTMLVYIGAIPLVATIVENVSPRGLDNVTVPAVVIVLLLVA